MSWYRNLKSWQQGLIGVVTFLVGFYLVLWLLSPYVQDLDDARCGIHVLLGQDCTYLFKP
jgi:hypothetical protein